jgi:ribose 5-phosphate isomerase RpiB
LKEELRSRLAAAGHDLVETFLAAEFSQAERHLRRLDKVAALEKKAASEVGAEAPAIPA